VDELDSDRARDGSVADAVELGIEPPLIDAIERPTRRSLVGAIGRSILIGGPTVGAGNGGKSRDERPQPLAARAHEVRGHLRQRWVAGSSRVEQPVVDALS
jgi:hypothetical protein